MAERPPNRKQPARGAPKKGARRRGTRAKQPAKAVSRAQAEAAAAAARTVRALELRIAGYSFRAIGAELQVSHTQARKDVEAALAELDLLKAETAETLRAVELERLDHAVRGIWIAVGKGSPMAIDRLLKISERRAKLCDLDAPTRHDFSGMSLEQKAELVRGLIALGLERKTRQEGSDA